MTATQRKIWSRGGWRDDDSYASEAWNRGTLYGDGLFETLRVAARKAIDLETHLSRFLFSARELGYPDAEALAGRARDAVVELADKGLTPEGVIRVTWVRGGRRRGFVPEPHAEPMVLAEWTVLPTDLGDRLRGVHAISAPDLIAGTAARHKSCSALVYVEAARRATEARVHEAILGDGDGGLAEGSTANLFVRAHTGWVTPPLDTPVLPGIVRAWVLAERTGEMHEEPIGPDDLANASEAFLTNSVSGIVPLLVVDGRRIASGEVGEETRALQLAYAGRHGLGVPNARRSP